MAKHKISQFAHKVKDVILEKAPACFSIEKENRDDTATLLTKANQEQTSQALIIQAFTKATPAEIALSLGLTISQYKNFVEHPSIIKTSLSEVITKDPAKALTKVVDTSSKEQQMKNANLHNDDLYNTVGVSLNNNMNEDTEESTIWLEKIEQVKEGETYSLSFLGDLAEEIMYQDGSEIGGDLDEDIGPQGIMFDFASQDEENLSYLQNNNTSNTVIIKQLVSKSGVLNKSNEEVSKVEQSSEVIGVSKDEAEGKLPDLLDNLRETIVNDVITAMGSLIIPDSMIEAC